MSLLYLEMSIMRCLYLGTIYGLQLFWLVYSDVMLFNDNSIAVNGNNYDRVLFHLSVTIEFISS